MPDTGWLKEVLKEVRKEVEEWPPWRRDREYAIDEGSGSLSTSSPTVNEEGQSFPGRDNQE